MSVINTNISALRASNASNAANKMLGTAMERLSTGKRINSAKDDAAGLAIATTMTAQVRGMNQAIRNANDGISLAQTAEGALSEVTNMLQRVRELAVQSASGLYQDATDRAYMQAEVDQLTAQMGQVITNTKFNGVVLFDASTAAVTVQSGANTADTVDLTMADLTALAANGGAAGSYDVSTAATANALLATLDTEIDFDLQRPRLARRRSEPAGIGGQQPQQQRHQPVGRAFADRGCGLFLGNHGAGQGPDPRPGLDRDDRPGQPEPAERAVAAALSQDPIRPDPCLARPAVRKNRRAFLCRWMGASGQWTGRECRVTPRSGKLMALAGRCEGDIDENRILGPSWP